MVEAGEGPYLQPTGNALIDLLQSGPTNAHPERGTGIPFPVARYRELFAHAPRKAPHRSHRPLGRS